MLFKLIRDFIKVSFNCEKELYYKIQEIKDFYFCSTTNIINEALRDYIKKFEKKKNRIYKEQNK